MEKSIIHPNYCDGEFSITIENGVTITNKNIGSSQTSLKVRVYNSDFIRDNLSWLHKADGTIEPFTILGEKNIEIDKKLREINNRLGSVDDSCGMLHELNKIFLALTAKSSELNVLKNEIDEKLRNKAREIKNNGTVYNYPTYTIHTIKSEIPVDTSTYILSDENTDSKKLLLKEVSKGKLSQLSSPKIYFRINYVETLQLLEKQIKPTEPIADLINDNILQEWVRRGIEQHKGKRKLCAFCSNELPSNLWEKLDAHFNKESDELRNAIARQILVLQAASVVLDSFLQLTSSQFYSSLQNRFTETVCKWESTKDIYKNNVQLLVQALEVKQNDIFKLKEIDLIEDNTNSISVILLELNELIIQNNKISEGLDLNQNTARSELRRSDVAKFVRDIEYHDKIRDITLSEADVEALQTLNDDKGREIDLIYQEKEMLLSQSQDESHGAELINQHLIRFFGHDELKLVTYGATPNIKFKITRGGLDVKDLSEGECSLISFCYFIARMEDEMKDDVNNGQLIIYIDDPISSLDSNHIFFIFSLIESVLAKPKAYGQLFISTHNLDFLKYLKRITVPTGHPTSYFLIERRQRQNDKRSFITPLPDHIKDYVTEFNYLFKEIYSVYSSVRGDKKRFFENTYNKLYNLPNNMRKFLECYLFYRYPNNKNPLDNLDKLFDDNIPCLINRVVNEYSHLTYIDRGWKPIDVDEAEECAKLIIEKIKSVDIGQYLALCQSVGVTDEPETTF